MGVALGGRDGVRLDIPSLSRCGMPGYRAAVICPVNF